MIYELYIWWAEQMRDLVPRSVRVRPAISTGLVAALDDVGRSLALSQRARRGSTELGRFPLDDRSLADAVALLPSAGREVTLQVPADAMLQHRVVLPLTAELDLRALLAFELDRLTPFRADQAFWSATIERRDAKAGRLHVKLIVAPHRRVQPAITALRQAGLEPARLAAEGQSGTMIELGAERPPTWAGRRARACAAATCAALALVAVALPFLQQSSAAAALEERVATLRPELAEAERLRREIVASRSTTDVVTAARQQIGQPIQALLVLTDVLPDDTVLSQLSARQRNLTLTGRAASAARLIGSMTATPKLRAAAFTSAVVRDDATSTEAFTIRTELAP